jgi:putative acetyltransferase
MKIRRADLKDIEAISKLYYDTIVTVNNKDYNDEQILAWSATASNEEGWVRRIEEQDFYVAIIDNKIVGFASIDNTGYLDLLYVHKDYQRQGIGSKLLQEMEKIAHELELKEVSVQSSFTAKPFFETHGFKVTGEKNKLVGSVPFTNPIMVKKLKQLAS